MTEKTRCPLFTLSPSLFPARWGELTLAGGPRPTVIKPCIMVISTRLKVITGSWCARSRWAAQVVSLLSALWSKQEQRFAPGSVWLRVKSVGIAVDPEVVSLWSNCDLFLVSILHIGSWQKLWFVNKLCWGDNHFTLFFNVLFSSFAYLSLIDNQLLFSRPKVLYIRKVKRDSPGFCTWTGNWWASDINENTGKHCCSFKPEG